MNKYYFYPFEFVKGVKNQDITDDLFYLASNGCIYKLNENVFESIYRMNLSNFKPFVIRDGYRVSIYFNFKNKLSKSVMRTLKVLKLSGVIDLDQISDTRLADYFNYRAEIDE